MVDMTSLLAVLLLEESPLPSPLPEEPPIDPSRVTPGLLALVSFVFLVIAIVLPCLAIVSFTPASLKAATTPSWMRFTSAPLMPLGPITANQASIT